MRKCVLVGVACLLWLVLLRTVTAEETAFVMAGFDGDTSVHQWETNDFFSRMEARSGIHFSFEEYTDYSKWQVAKQNMFTSGPLPDVFFKAALSTDELMRYMESGHIIDLMPLLEENAPHLWSLLTEYPQWMEAITLPNGKIGALPAINQMPAQNAMWINKRWLDELKLDIPIDAQSLLTVLRAFQTLDPNRNGQRDEVPLTFFGVWDLKFLSHAFGAVADDFNVYLDANGIVHYWPLEDSFVELLRYLHGIYQEKLIDQNGFFAAGAMQVSTGQNTPVRYGMFFGPNPLILLNHEESGQFVLLPPLRYEGKQIYRNLYGEIIRGTFAISSACVDPAALLRWVDVLYTEEGAIEAMAGIEGVDYFLNDDGSWIWEGGLDNLSMDRINDITLYSTGNMPWLFPIDFHNRFGEDGVRRISDELQKLRLYLKTPVPFPSLTPEERERVMSMQDELGVFVDEGFARFVLGQDTLTDEGVELFRQGLLERGASEMIVFWQDILK